MFKTITTEITIPTSEPSRKHRQGAAVELQWVENEHREHVADYGGYIITHGWKLPDVPRWEVHVTSPELGPGEGGLGVLRYIGSRDSLEDAKAFAQRDYDSRYNL